MPDLAGPCKPGARSALALLAAEDVVDRANNDARFLAGEAVMDRLAIVAASRDQSVAAQTRELLAVTVG